MHKISLLAGAVAIDLLIGDPRWLPHPVVAIGAAINWLERPLRKMFRPKTGGVVLCAAIVSAAFGVFYLLQKLFNAIPFGFIGTAFFLSMAIALRGLVFEAGKIMLSLKIGNVEKARENLKALCGRDTDNLNERGIIRAVIESVAENASDGVIAPAFYYIVGGLPLAMAYKAANTLDSMVGYKNEKYMDFGWASARLDDIANFIPARLTGIFISLASGRNFARALKTMMRDGGNHPSPNSGRPMSAMAGALGVALGGPAVYQGVLEKKPFIGSGGELPGPDSGRKAVRLTLAGSLIGMLIMGAGYAAIFH